ATLTSLCIRPATNTRPGETRGPVPRRAIAARSLPAKTKTSHAVDHEALSLTRRAREPLKAQEVTRRVPATNPIWKMKIREMKNSMTISKRPQVQTILTTTASLGNPPIHPTNRAIRAHQVDRLREVPPRVPELNRKARVRRRSSSTSVNPGRYLRPGLRFFRSASCHRSPHKPPRSRSWHRRSQERQRLPPARPAWLDACTWCSDRISLHDPTPSLTGSMVSRPAPGQHH